MAAITNDCRRQGLYLNHYCVSLPSQGGIEGDERKVQSLCSFYELVAWEFAQHFVRGHVINNNSSVMNTVPTQGNETRVPGADFAASLKLGQQNNP
uniref:Uncharacterized protein n=1 Tax=Timema poppense TaxID=170557 RepID=A0A7R9DCK0_TIMPO|nr:unnamed protein product [Timema poppensis]